MRVSVIVPCYNAERYLAQTIGSVLEQTRLPDEIIVVDDGSADDSLSIAKAFAANYERVHVLTRRSGSAAATRNLGAAVSTGDFLMFLDADDVLAPDTLAALTAAAAETSFGIALCPWRRMESVDGKWVDGPATGRPRRRNMDDLGNWLVGWYHPPCSVLWSRLAYQMSGGWDPDAVVNNDGDIMMRALVNGVSLIRTAVGTGYYRKVPASLSSRRSEYAGLAARLRAIDKVIWLLEGQGRLEAYRPALNEALTALAANARDQAPELSRAAAQRKASLYGGIARLTVAATLRRLRRQQRRRWQEPLLDATERLSHAPATGQEIRYGLDQAAPRSTTDLHRAAGAAEAMSVRYAFPPLVSVIVPTHNRADLLPRTLASVFCQTFANLEILVVDDGSTDGTRDLIAAMTDDRLRYLYQSNRGAGSARNHGLREARGDYIAFLDSDDEWLPAKTALQLERFAQLSGAVGLMYSGAESVLPNEERLEILPVARGDLYRELLLKNVMHGGGSSSMIRRSVVSTIGFFDESLPAIEDYDYWLRIARFFQIDYVNEVLARYHEPLDIRRRSLDPLADLDARLQFYAKWGQEMRRAGLAHRFLLDLSRRHILAPKPDRRAARRLALRAMALSPGPRTVRQALGGLFARTRS